MARPLIISVFLLFAAGVNSLADSSSASDDVAFFQSYLRINTAHPNPSYAAAASFLRSLAADFGLESRTLYFTADKSKPLVLVSYYGSDPSLPPVLLNSHIDSVPAEPDKWVHPPFAAHLDHATGRIYARGAQDDKCLAIQYLCALRNLKSNDFTPLRTVHVSLVPDEEIGGAAGMAAFVNSDYFKELNVGFVLDEGQASPNDEFRVFYADRIPWRLIVKATGSPAHGSRMLDGMSMENLMDCVEAITKFRDAQFRLVKAGLKAPSEVISVNPVYMKAGTPTPTGFIMNIQPSDAELGFDVRIPPTEDPEILKRRLREEWAPAHRNMTFQLIKAGPSGDHMGRPLVTLTDNSNPWWSALNEAILSYGGKLGKPEILSSTTDSRFIRFLGIPALGFSPMANTPVLLHDHNEFLEDKVFLKGIEVYERVIRALSCLPENS